MTSFNDLFPELANKIKAIYPAPENLYKFSDRKISALYVAALKTDPEIDDSLYLKIMEVLPQWLEYPIIVDYFTDEERSEFEKIFLHEKENAHLRAFLNHNKLRQSSKPNGKTCIG
jgi:hypothetical protein